MLSDTKENWPYYSAALVKIQTDFVRELPASVKDLIRLVKYWHKTFISQTGGEHLLPYYLLELLTIHAWENANRPEEFDMRIGFKAVMEVLQNNRSLHVSWDRYFKRDLIPSRYIHEVFKTSFPRIKGAVFYTLEDHRRTGVQAYGPHPGDISQAHEWQKDGKNAFSCRRKSLQIQQIIRIQDNKNWQPL